MATHTLEKIENTIQKDDVREYTPTADTHPTNKGFTDRNYAKTTGSVANSFHTLSIPSNTVVNDTSKNLAVNCETLNNYLTTEELSFNSFKFGTGQKVDGISNSGSVGNNDSDKLLTQSAILSMVNYKAGTKSRVIEAINFNGSSDRYLLNNRYWYIFWESSKHCLRFMAKNSVGFGWYDAGLMISREETIKSINDDISSTTGGWKYFGQDGAHDAQYDLTSYGCLVTAVLAPEGYGTGIPIYRIELVAGNYNNIGVMIYEITK